MFRKAVVSLCAVLAASAALAADTPDLMVPVDRHVLDPERKIEDVHQDAKPEWMYEVATAHVVIADYDLLKHDFPFLQGMTHTQIDRWLLDNGGAYISEAQARQAVVNTPIQLTGRKRLAYRPPSYGRAIVYEVQQDGFRGLIDSNGDGVRPDRNPSHGSHGNGLGTLAEKIRDFLFENAFRASLIHANSEIGSVGSYAVIGYGFDVRYPNGDVSPAGKYMRQAHRRLNYEDGNVRAAWLPGEFKDPVARHISKYGFYTGWEFNLQGIRKNGRTFVFDYGHWIVWQGQVPENGIWVDPSLSPDFNNWGWDPWNGPDRSQDQWRTSQMDKPFNWSREVAWADKFGRGKESIIGHYNNMVGNYLRKLNVGKAPTADLPNASVINCIDMFR